MWCCGVTSDSSKQGIEAAADNDGQTVNEFEIKEWNMTLRENNICMDEYNVEVNRTKIETIEKIEAERRLSQEQEMDFKEKELLLLQQLLESSRTKLKEARKR